MSKQRTDELPLPAEPQANGDAAPPARRSRDSEAKALFEIIDRLEALDAAPRARVLAYLRDRFAPSPLTVETEREATPC